MIWLASMALGLGSVLPSAPPSPAVQAIAVDVICVPGEEACVVALDDGRLLRIDLETGDLEASGWYGNHWSTELSNEGARLLAAGFSDETARS